ncbi:MAG: ATP-grasp domain-containing protein [Thermacetogeniaceae bacterium]|jgi:carbamoyl-phosphate synthase large subunit|nr:ATP-grasp domain-containing protein [Thermoanaerobacterales bacterium]NLN20399.1 ATP-grasp domain-containing protein [Syntrophomonadaceae bacterium]
MNKQIKVLLTATGGLAGYSHYRLLKSIQTFQVEVVAADINSIFNYTSFTGEPLELIPKGEEDEFINALLKICINKEVNVVFPCSSNELVPLAKNRDRFKRHGVVVAVSHDPVELAIACDKLSALDRLAQQSTLANFVPRYYRLCNKADLFHAANELGYPHDKLVFKPRFAQGGRGMVLLGHPKKDEWLRSKNGGEMSLEWLDSLVEEDELADFFIMEYLPGVEYSVDVLCYEGKPEIIIPRERKMVVDGKAVVSRLLRHEGLITCVKELIQMFNLSYIVNIQFKEDRYGQPKLLEINARVPGTLAADLAGGINMFEEALNLIYFGRIKNREVCWETECGRFFQELYR